MNPLRDLLLFFRAERDHHGTMLSSTEHTVNAVERRLSCRDEDELLALCAGAEEFLSLCRNELRARFEEM